MSEQLYRPVGARAGWTLHTSQDCPALQGASSVEEADPDQYPHRDQCRRCADDVDTTGGGSRELYEQIKQIGEQRTEATNDD